MSDTFVKINLRLGNGAVQGKKDIGNLPRKQYCVRILKYERGAQTNQGVMLGYLNYFVSWTNERSKTRILQFHFLLLRFSKDIGWALKLFSFFHFPTAAAHHSITQSVTSLSLSLSVSLFLSLSFSVSYLMIGNCGNKNPRRVQSRGNILAIRNRTDQLWVNDRFGCDYDFIATLIMRKQ